MCNSTRKYLRVLISAILLMHWVLLCCCCCSILFMASSPYWSYRIRCSALAKWLSMLLHMNIICLSIYSTPMPSSWPNICTVGSLITSSVRLLNMTALALSFTMVVLTCTLFLEAGKWGGRILVRIIKALLHMSILPISCCYLLNPRIYCACKV